MEPTYVGCYEEIGFCRDFRWDSGISAGVATYSEDAAPKAFGVHSVPLRVFCISWLIPVPGQHYIPSSL